MDRSKISECILDMFNVLPDLQGLAMKHAEINVRLHDGLMGRRRIQYSLPEAGHVPLF
jgi:hypothetical protein